MAMSEQGSLTQPPPRPDGARTTAPSRAGYWIAAVVVVLSLAFGLGWGIPAYQHMQHDIKGFARSPMPGSISMNLPASTGRVVYYEGPGSATLDLLGLRVTGPNGEPIPVRGYSMNVEYNAPGETHGHAVGTFDTGREGTYTVTVRATAPNAMVAVGGSFVAHAGWQAAAATVVAVLGLIAAAVLVVVTAVRRNGSGRTWKGPSPSPAALGSAA